MNSNNNLYFLKNERDLPQVILGSCGSFILMVPFFVPLGPTGHALMWTIVWISICRNNYILHNHVHKPFFNQRKINRIFDVILSVSTGMTSGNWRISHVHGHHIEQKFCLPRAREYKEKFKIYNARSFSFLGAFIYVVRTTPIQFFYPLALMLRGSFGSKTFKRVYYRYYLLEHILVYGIAILALVWKPYIALSYIILPYVLTYLISRYVDYVSHFGLSVDDQLGFSNVCTSRIYNFLFWNFGYHIVHHMNPHIHWSELPNYYDRLNAEEAGRDAAKSINLLGLMIPPLFRWRKVRRPTT